MTDGQDRTADRVRSALSDRADRVRYSAPVPMFDMDASGVGSSARWVPPALVAACLVAIVGIGAFWLAGDDEGVVVTTTPDDDATTEAEDPGEDEEPGLSETHDQDEPDPGDDAVESSPDEPVEDDHGADDPVPAGPSIRVWGVERTDVLNMRSGAGTDNDVVAMLGHDAGGLSHTGAVANVGTQIWWEVSAPDGVTGWVNRRFLAVGRDDLTTSDEAGLIALAVEAFDALGPSPSAIFGGFADSFSVGGLGIAADLAVPFQPVDHRSLDTPRDWDLGFDVEPGECPECLGVTPRTLLDIGERELSEARFSVGPDDDFREASWGITTGLPPAFYESLVTVTAYTPQSVEGGRPDWSRYTFVFDFPDGEPVIAGVFRYGWTP